MKSSSNTVNSSSSLSDWLQNCETFIKIGVSHIILNRSLKQQKDINDLKVSTSAVKKNTESVNLNLFKYSVKDYLNNDEAIEKINCLINFKTKELEDDEYAGLKPIKYSSSISTLNKRSNCKIISLSVYFKRKNVRFAVEIWRFIINFNSQVEKSNFRKIFLFKKLSVFIRTIQTLISILPLDSLFKSNIFEFDYELEVERDVNGSLNSKIESNKNVNFKKIQFSNYSDAIGSIKLEIYYLNKNAILNYEDELKQSNFYEENTVLRQRFVSESRNTIQTVINSDIDLKRNNSKSVENANQINFIQIDDYIEIVKDKEEKNKVSQKYSGTTASSSNNNFLHKTSRESLIINTIASSDNNVIISPPRSFMEFVSVRNDDINNKINEFKILQYILNNLDLDNSSSTSEELEYSFISNSDAEFIDITGEEYSDFELKGIVDEPLFEDINKSYIESNNKIELDKVLFSYTKLKNKLTQDDKFSLNIRNLMKCKNLLNLFKSPSVKFSNY